MTQFITDDIQLASYLCSKGVILIGIQPLDRFHSKFIFEKPPKELLDYWLSGASSEKSLINAYRHLLKDSRQVQLELNGGERW
ncbi:MAG: hypothetical protein ACTSPB_07160 [Candidatus Thorarchaeota archaeon]